MTTNGKKAMNRIRYLLMAAPAMTSVATAQKDIAGRQYWLNAGITGVGGLTSDHAAIDISSLSPGLHSLTHPRQSGHRHVELAS